MEKSRLEKLKAMNESVKKSADDFNDNFIIDMKKDFTTEDFQSLSHYISNNYDSEIQSDLKDPKSDNKTKLYSNFKNLKFDKGNSNSTENLNQSNSNSSPKKKVEYVPNKQNDSSTNQIKQPPSNNSLIQNKYFQNNLSQNESVVQMKSIELTKVPSQNDDIENKKMQNGCSIDNLNLIDQQDSINNAKNKKNQMSSYDDFQNNLVFDEDENSDNQVDDDYTSNQNKNLANLDNNQSNRFCIDENKANKRYNLKKFDNTNDSEYVTMNCRHSFKIDKEISRVFDSLNKIYARRVSVALNILKINTQKSNAKNISKTFQNSNNRIENKYSNPVLQNNTNTSLKNNSINNSKNKTNNKNTLIKFNSSSSEEEIPFKNIPKNNDLFKESVDISNDKLANTSDFSGNFNFKHNKQNVDKNKLAESLVYTRPNKSKIPDFSHRSRSKSKERDRSGSREIPNKNLNNNKSKINNSPINSKSNEFIQNNKSKSTKIETSNFNWKNHDNSKESSLKSNKNYSQNKIAKLKDDKNKQTFINERLVPGYQKLDYNKILNSNNKISIQKDLIDNKSENSIKACNTIVFNVLAKIKNKCNSFNNLSKNQFHVWKNITQKTKFSNEFSKFEIKIENLQSEIRVKEKNLNELVKNKKINSSTIEGQEEIIDKLTIENSDIKKKQEMITQSNKAASQTNKDQKTRLDELINENMILKLQMEDMKAKTKYSLNDNEKKIYENLLDEDRKILRNCNVTMYNNQNKMDKITKYFENFLNVDENEILSGVGGSNLANFATNKQTQDTFAQNEENINFELQKIEEETIKKTKISFLFKTIELLAKKDDVEIDEEQNKKIAFNMMKFYSYNTWMMEALMNQENKENQSEIVKFKCNELQKKLSASNLNNILTRKLQVNQNLTINSINDQWIKKYEKASKLLFKFMSDKYLDTQNIESIYNLKLTIIICSALNVQNKQVKLNKILSKKKFLLFWQYQTEKIKQSEQQKYNSKSTTLNSKKERTINFELSESKQNTIEDSGNLKFSKDKITPHKLKSGKRQNDQEDDSKMNEFSVLEDKSIIMNTDQTPSPNTQIEKIISSINEVKRGDTNSNTIVISKQIDKYNDNDNFETNSSKGSKTDKFNSKYQIRQAFLEKKINDSKKLTKSQEVMNRPKQDDLDDSQLLKKIQNKPKNQEKSTSVSSSKQFDVNTSYSVQNPQNKVQNFFKKVREESYVPSYPSHIDRIEHVPKELKRSCSPNNTNIKNLRVSKENIRSSSQSGQESGQESDQEAKRDNIHHDKYNFVSKSDDRVEYNNMSGMSQFDNRFQSNTDGNNNNYLNNDPCSKTLNINQDNQIYKKENVQKKKNDIAPIPKPNYRNLKDKDLEFDLRSSKGLVELDITNILEDRSMQESNNTIANTLNLYEDLELQARSSKEIEALKQKQKAIDEIKNGDHLKINNQKYDKSSLVERMKKLKEKILK